MDPINGILIYILIWWVTLFVVLPIGVRGQAEENDIVPGSEPGAPVKSDMPKKFLVTTILSAFIWIVVCFIIVNDLFGVTQN